MKNEDYALLASICRDDTSALNAILYNNSKATSAVVVEEMLFKTVNNKCEDSAILAMFDYAMAVDLKEAGFNNVYFTTDCPVIIRKTKEGLEAKTGIEVLTLKEIEDMKFNVIAANPPYKGVSALHQQFFNKALELLVDDGQMAFIQPASPYLNKKENKKVPDAKMLENVKEHTTHVKLMDGCKVFPEAEVGSNLAVTYLQKDYSNSGKVEFLEYCDGTFYENIEIDGIVRTEMEPTIFIKLKKRVSEYVSEHGSIQDVIVDPSNVGDDKHKGTRFYIQGIRGHVGSADFFTFCSKDSEFDRVESGRGIPVKNDKQLKNVRLYLQSKVARFCLSILKYNVQLSRGELTTVPLVNFNYKWDDESLCELMGITKKEYKEIVRVIPDYY